MKILFVISALGIGGEQRVLSIITEKLILKGHSVDVATFEINDKSFEINKNVKVIKINKTDKFKNLLRLLKIREIIKTGKYDVVIGFAVIPSILCSIASIRTKTPVIVCERNDPGIYRKTWKLVRAVAYKFASGSIFQTLDAKKYFQRVIKNGVIIPNPIDVKKLPVSNKKHRNKRIVNTARLTDAKNQELLINAFAKIEKKFPEYTLAIYGDGQNRSKLLNLVKKHGLTHKIQINEATPNVLEEIVDDELFVLSSNNEGFPNSLAEAMAIGLPVISTDCRIGGPRDMITNFENGLLVRVDNIDDLTTAMTKCLSDEELRSKLSKNAQTIKYKLNAEAITNRWIKYLKYIDQK